MTDLLSKRIFVGGSCAIAAAAGLPILRSQAQALRPSIIDNDTTALRAAASAQGILYGSAVSSPELRDEDFRAVLAREAAILVPEYEMKRAIVEPTRDAYDLSGCDRLLAFGRGYGMQFRGHPLVWHKRNPDWLEEAVLSTHDETLITTYIEKVAGHFRGQMHSWDVVNEAIAPEDGRPDDLRKSFWLEAFGPHYIDIAYHAARATDPGAVLVYNDWGCELGAPANDRFRAATLAFLEQVLARGVPIDALGLQGHMRAFGTPVDQQKLRIFLDRVKALGLQILVTEHDVDDSGGPSDIAERDRAVADASRRFLDVMVAAGAIAILTWGLTDRFLASPGWRARLDGYEPRMLPLDSDLRPTPMRQAMLSAFAAR
ncbi:MAG TPA: endo-1,4-beta-xylanase [Rhizomicrobium sp.]|nr:endo-1,4-beta-xylanase [Rhizomicrobium sp.]